MYREKWTSRLTTDEDFKQVVKDYGSVIEKLTGEEIKRGLDACLGKFDFPPTPADFYRVAKHNDDPASGVNGQAYRILNTKLLTRKMTDEQKQLGREALNSIKLRRTVQA